MNILVIDVGGTHVKVLATGLGSALIVDGIVERGGFRLWENAHTHGTADSSVNPLGKRRETKKTTT